MKKLIVVASLLSLIAVFGISGCSTMQGVGKDIQKGGEAIEKSAE